MMITSLKKEGQGLREENFDQLFQIGHLAMHLLIEFSVLFFAR